MANKLGIDFKHVAATLYENLLSMQANDKLKTLENLHTLLIAVKQDNEDSTLPNHIVQFLHDVCVSLEFRSQSKVVNSKSLLLLSLLSQTTDSDLIDISHIKQQIEVTSSQEPIPKELWLLMLPYFIHRNDSEMTPIADIVSQGVISSNKGYFHSKSSVLLLRHAGKEFSFASDQVSELSEKCGQLILYKCSGDSAQRKSPGSFLGKSPSAGNVSSITELDGSPAHPRDLFTVLNNSRTYHTPTFLSIFTFSVLKQWLSYLDTHGDSMGFLNKHIERLMERSNSGSPASITSSRFSSGSDTTSIHSLSSSVTSYQSVFDGDVHDQLDNRALQDVRSFSLYDSRPVTPSRSHSILDSRIQSPGGLSRTSSIMSFDQHMSMNIDTSVNSNLKTASVAYCLRIIGQSERTPKHEFDRDIISAAVVEAIDILGYLSAHDAQVCQKVFPEIKRMMKRLQSVPLKARKVYVALLDFGILNYADMASNVEDALNIYLKELPNKCFTDTHAAFELFHFCLKNKHFFQNQPTLLTSHLPNILKFLAWWPCSFIDEVCELMPLFVSDSKIIIELLHILLDLPTLAALLELQEFELLGDLSQIAKREALEEVLGQAVPPYFKALCGHILRPQSGGAETIDKLGELHTLIKKLAASARVDFSCDITIVLLSSFFECIKGLGKLEILKDLFPVLLERSQLIFPSGKFQEDISEYIMSVIEWILMQYPSLLATYQSELLSSLNQVQNFPSDVGGFGKLLIKCIAEFSSADLGCDYEKSFKYYERLETLVYESKEEFGSSLDGLYGPETFCTLITSLARLAASWQELIPRAVMCLSKVSCIEWKSSYAFDFDSFTVVSERAYEMLCMLQKPKVAHATLSSAQLSEPWHLDPNSSLMLKVHILADDTSDDADIDVTK